LKLSLDTDDVSREKLFPMIDQKSPLNQAIDNYADIHQLDGHFWRPTDAFVWSLIQNEIHLENKGGDFLQTKDANHFKLDW